MRVSAHWVGTALANQPALHYHDGLARQLPAVGEGAVEPFRILEHPADVGFEAWGATREEVFAHAARALFHLIVEPESVVPREEMTVRVEGRDPPDLLVNWLSELLYLHDAEGWLFCDFELRALEDTSLAAVARGERMDRARHQLRLMVKAITYHQLALEQTPQGWHARVYVDI
jgi:SHS2 domain-containing protein